MTAQDMWAPAGGRPAVFDPRHRLAVHRAAYGGGPAGRAGGHRVRPSHRPWSTLMLTLQWVWVLAMVASVGLVLAVRPQPTRTLLGGLALVLLVVHAVPVLTVLLRRRADRGAARGLQVWAAGCALLTALSLALQAVRFSGLVSAVLAGVRPVPAGLAGTPATMSVTGLVAAQSVALLLALAFFCCSTATAVRLDGYLRL